MALRAGDGEQVLKEPGKNNEKPGSSYTEVRIEIDIECRLFNKGIRNSC